jgi:hypothetical protein
MPDDMQDLLYLAAAEPVGLIIRTSDVAATRSGLYKTRAKLNDPALADLQFRLSPFVDGDIVICKRRVITSALEQPTDGDI